MPINAEKLRRAIQHSKRVLAPFREKRTEMIRDYCGSEYGDWAKDRPTYLNIMHQAADTYTQVLAANRPRALVSTDYEELKWFSRHFERALNNHIQEIRLEEELRYCVLEAFFCMGIMKIYYGADTEIKLDDSDTWVDPGRPYAEHVSLDNFGFDVTASHWRKRSFSYDEYFLSKRDLLDDPELAKHRDKIANIQTGNSQKHNSQALPASSLTYPSVRRAGSAS
ncbi:MAG: hypothetical protein ACYTFQ_32325 [Planctomycetota bacterium]|jgi:hypothetical protein